MPIFLFCKKDFLGGESWPFATQKMVFRPAKAILSECNLLAFDMQKTAFGVTKAHLLMPILVLTLRLGSAFVHLFVNLLMAER